MPVGVHVSAYNATDPMLQDYLPGLPSAQAVMAFSIGNMIASAAFIVGGVLDRHPKLRVVHLESGAGWAAFWLDRLKAGLMGGFRDVDIPGLSCIRSSTFSANAISPPTPTTPVSSR